MPSVIHHVRRNADKWVSFIVGTTAFLILVGPQVLSPTSTKWLRWGDAAQHYYGWEFFRRSPLLQFPLGDSPRFGTGYSSSVVYTDSIPLLAIPFKYLTFWFDAEFQYFGLWLLFCFVAQYFVAHRVLQQFGVCTGIARIGAVFFLLAPAFLNRQTHDGYGHMALVGHFLVLSALSLTLEQQFRTRLWTLLILITVLVQFYLFAIVALFWLIRILTGVTSHEVQSKAALKHVLLVVACLVPIMSLAGYFSSGSTTEEGYGIFRADLATFVDPANPSITPWSRLLPDQPVNPRNTDGTAEGFAFLGLGVVLALGVAAVLNVRRNVVEKLRVVMRKSNVSAAVSASLLSFIFALSNRVTFRTERLILPVPEYWQPLTSALRTTGRFVWPLMYLTIFSAIALLVRKLSKKIAYFAITCLLIAQVFDSQMALREHRERFTQFLYPASVMQSPEWPSVAEKSKAMLISPTPYKGAIWQDFAEFALSHGLTTNAAYLSRIDYGELKQADEVLTRHLLDQDFQIRTMYVVRRDSPVFDSLIETIANNGGEFPNGFRTKLLDEMLVIFQ